MHEGYLLYFLLKVDVCSEKFEQTIAKNLSDKF